MKNSKKSGMKPINEEFPIWLNFLIATTVLGIASAVSNFHLDHFLLVLDGMLFGFSIGLLIIAFVRVLMKPRADF